MWWFIEVMTESLINDLRTINHEVERAHHSWIVFWQSMREMGAGYDKIIQAFDSRDIGPTVNHIQVVLLHDCVAGICRVTDEHRPDRVTLNSVMRQLRSEFATGQPEGLKILDDKRRAIAKSEYLAELRVIRNVYIGHLLREEPPPTTYYSIPQLIDGLTGFLEASFQLCGDARWIGQMTSKKKTKLATEFWDCLEAGAQVRSST